jgi:hypothetical protein
MKNKVCAVLIEVTHHSDGVSLCGDILKLNEENSVEREVYTKNDFKKPRQKNFDLLFYDWGKRKHVTSVTCA